MDKDMELSSMITLFMFDDVDVNLLPANGYAYAGYLDGNYANFAQVKAAHPQAHLVGIVTRASDDGDALDVEPGDATIVQAHAWVGRQQARGAARPIVYVSAGNAQQLIDTLAGAGISRPAYRLWSAHYGFGQHTCGPQTCKYPQADATQFTSKALGESLDESEIADDFFGPQPLTFPIKQGDMGTEVVTLQKMLNAWASVIGLAPVLVPDGNFGAKTLTAVQRAQRRFTLAPNGECDHPLWTDLSGKPTQPPVPGAPLTAPSPVGVTNKGSEVTFSWPPVGGAADYQIDVTGTSNDVIGDWTVTSTRAVIGINAHPTFLWKMRAGNGNGWGPWGATRTYSVR
jgi:peptidoglycan hydrolase-like protein with peptidoglycan-binding domain